MSLSFFFNSKINQSWFSFLQKDLNVLTWSFAVKLYRSTYLPVAEEIGTQDL